MLILSGSRPRCAAPASGAPVGDDEPTYNAGTDTLVLSDTFDSYANTAAFESSPWIVDRSSYLSLVTGRGGSGQAIRSTYAEGSNTGTLVTRTFSEHQFLYAQWYFRVTSGIDLTQGGLSEGPKNFEAWRVSSGRLTAGCSGTNLANQQGGSKVGVEFQFRDNQMVATLGSEIGFTQDVKTPRFDTCNDGNWHRLTYMLDNGSGMTSFALWLDGTQVRTPTGPHATASDGWDELRWFDIIPGGVRSGFSFTWDIDDLVVWEPA